MLLHVTKLGKLDKKKSYTKIILFQPSNPFPVPKQTMSQFLKESAGWYFES